MAEHGPVEKSVRVFIKRIMPLKNGERPLVFIALRLARSLDDAEADERTLPTTSRELRAILEKLQEGRSGEDELELDSPV